MCCDVSNFSSLPDFGLSKEERLHFNSDIDTLFKQGTWFSQDEFSIIFRVIDGNMPSAMFAVPKKFQHKAWQRVKSRRVMRELYRKNKHILYDVAKKSDKTIHFAIICRNTEALEYHQTESKIILTLQRLSDKLSKA